MNDASVLFISRKYPPSVGGMEQQAAGLIASFTGKKKTILLRRSSRAHLIWFLPYAFFKGLWLSRSVDLIHLCDGVLIPLGWFIRLFTSRPATVTIHGLDIVYSNIVFRFIHIPLIRRLDHVIAVSEKTSEECLKRGVRPERITVIPNGVDSISSHRTYSRFDLEKKIGLPTQNKKIILFLGRLVERKGIVWFLQSVFPLLPTDIVLVVCGAGPLEKKIKRIIRGSDQKSRIVFLGLVSHHDRDMLMQTSDCFIMPNISVLNDREGFGIAGIEAAMAGLPVIAASTDGIPQAIHNGKNGYLVPPQDPVAFSQKISDVILNLDRPSWKIQSQTYCETHFSWKTVSAQYKKIFNSIVEKTF